MRKKVLVSGAAGFAGRYMCDYLAGLADRPEVIGTDIIASESNRYDAFYEVDLSSSAETEKLIKQIQPDYIIHLAGTFGTSESQEIYKVNVLSAASLLEAVRLRKSDAIVIIAGSAAEYGSIAAGQLPVTEKMSCNPVTSYGLSKLLATQVSLYYHRVHGLKVMIVRPFQLIGKGVTTRLAPGAFAEQIRKSVTSGTNVVKVGNLQSSRDFLDIYDAIEAIWELCRKPAPGEIFNICSGNPVKMADLLKMMITCAGADIKIEIDPERLRGASDVNNIYGSYAKLQQHCGWKPKMVLEVSVRNIFE
jgi:GDP-4-dehydro-6-deoxy-D-mannose reductase